MSMFSNLERMVDKHSVLDVLIALKNVCEDKAVHIDVNWQDSVLANEWMKAARMIQQAGLKLPYVPGIR